MRKIELEELKKIQLDILNAFRDICRQHGLRYFLAAGTALGAIRHQGFIPWDDDVDVFMTRDDYEKLLTLNDTDCPRYYKLLHLRNVAHFGLPIALLVDTRTYVEEKQLLPELVNRRHGVHIEIFPIDGLPNNSLLRRWHWTKCNFIRRMMYLCLFDKFVPSHKHGFIVNLMGRLATNGGKRFFGYQYFLNKLNTICQRYDVKQSNFVAPISWECCIINIPVAYINSDTKVSFEGKTHSTFANIEGYLQMMYGDYMQLPPEDQRRGHEISAWWKI